MNEHVRGTLQLGDVSYLKVAKHKHLPRWFVLCTFCVDCNNLHLYTDLGQMVFYLTLNGNRFSAAVKNTKRIKKKRKLVPHLSKVKCSVCPRFLSVKGQEKYFLKFSGNCRYRMGERWFVLLRLLMLKTYLYLLLVLIEAHAGIAGISFLRTLKTIRQKKKRHHSFCL